MSFRSTRKLVRTRGCLIWLPSLLLLWIILTGMSLCWFPSQGRSDTGALAELEVYAVHEAQARYHAQFHRYASLSELGPDGSGFIHGDLARGYVLPYTFTMKAQRNSYWIAAAPQSQGQLERHPDICCRLGQALVLSFYSDESRVVRFSKSCVPASSNSPPLE